MEILPRKHSWSTDLYRRVKDEWQSGGAFVAYSNGTEIFCKSFRLSDHATGPYGDAAHHSQLSALAAKTTASYDDVPAPETTKQFLIGLKVNPPPVVRHYTFQLTLNGLVKLDIIFKSTFSSKHIGGCPILIVKLTQLKTKTRKDLILLPRNIRLKTQKSLRQNLNYPRRFLHSSG
ncbi:hypothetical protein CEXT_803501 [Caerostris extrusa]|uniref:Uncharacterized protein n=1 Tax=Caerostris extrusa TaxID=172846 RepID=A0AAV4NWU5_CAEEX|nr:hypothetical protein CEXT_803501 [Caerostris extrusa]